MLRIALRSRSGTACVACPAQIAVNPTQYRTATHTTSCLAHTIEVRSPDYHCDDTDWTSLEWCSLDGLLAHGAIVPGELDLVDVCRWAVTEQAYPYQVEYAMEAVKKGTCAVCADIGCAVTVWVWKLTSPHLLNGQHLAGRCQGQRHSSPRSREEVFTPASRSTHCQEDRNARWACLLCLCRWGLHCA